MMSHDRSDLASGEGANEIADDAPASESATAGVLDYLRLFRLPNVFTAIADTAMALAVAAHLAEDYTPNFPAIGLLFLATMLLYISGMVLNDVFDYEQDCEQRPNRPLPSGRIDRAFAKKLGLAMWCSGGVAAPLAVWLQGGDWEVAAACSLGLMAAIWSYDAGGKRWVIGPYLMGACRTLNILVALNMTGDHLRASLTSGGWAPELAGPWLLAAGIGVYIAGITWFARTETADASHRGMLCFGLTQMVAGIFLVMIFPDHVGGEPIWRLPSTTHFFLMMMILALPVVRRAAIAIMGPSPERVQATIKQGIFSLIVFDSGITLMVAPTWMAVAILLLLLPTLTLGKWVYAT